MRRVLKWTARILFILIAIPVVAMAIVLIGLNIGPGQRLLEQQVGPLSGGLVTLAGVSGRFPDAPRIGRVEVRDTQGVWLTAEDVALDWSPLALIGRNAKVDRLTVARIAVARLPVAAPAAPQPAQPSQPLSLPVRIDAAALHVARIDLAAPVAGVAAALAVDGSAHVASLSDGDANILIRRLDGGGTYAVQGKIDAARLSAKLDAQEPAHGLVSAIAKLPDLGALSVQASVDGPWTAAATDLALAAGPLRAAAKGTVNVTGQAADLDITAAAPAMTPAPGVSWQSVALDAHVRGPLAKPEATGTLSLDQLAAAGAAVRHLAADIQGNAGRVGLKATIEGLRIPGPKPELLEAAPLTFAADARLDDPARPVAFDLAHPLVALNGSAQTRGDQTGGALAVAATLGLPDLAPFAAIGGIDLHGRTDLAIKASVAGDTTTATVDGTLAVTGGQAPIPGLIGPDAKIGVTAGLKGSDIALSRLDVNGRTVILSAAGGLAGGAVTLDWKLALSDLRVLAATVEGALAAQGHVAGKTDDLAAQVNVTGDVGTKGFPRGPIKLALDAKGLPASPSGTVTAEGSFDGAPLTLAARADRAADGTLAIAIERAAWKSAQAEGAATLKPGATLPAGKLSLRMTRLDDLRPFVGQALSGGIVASAQLGDEAGRETARVELEARGAGLPGTVEVGTATLKARVFDPTTNPDVQAQLAVDGLRASGVGGSVRASVDGRQDALGLKLSADLTNVGGQPLQATTAATVNATAKTVAVSALQAVYKGETVGLLAPARVSFGNGVAVDRARIGLRQAVLDIAGRASPTLDLTVALRNVTADLVRIVQPDLQAEGALQADARLTGTPAAPAGTVRLTATGLRLRSGPASALPAANITANATLAGKSARIDTRVTAGRNQVTVTGTAPIDPAGALDLRAVGGIDLALLDPILSARGQRVKGQLTLDAGVTGTLAAPRATGTVRLANGDVQDFGQGARIENIQALIEATGETVRIASFSGKAGAGTISASGTVGLAAPMPVDISLNARNASPLASDKLTAALDMALSLKGQVQGRLDAAGTITIRKADIRVPESLPVKVAVLNVRRPGDKPPPPAAPGPDIGLNLTLDAPGQIFVRGRGLDAELEGRLVIHGTANKPQPEGSFKLRRGTFSLAGQTLTFTTGEVGFDGSGKLDPTLNFVATSANATVTATLTITGYASAPKIALSSVPQLPQDEVLAQLLFHQSASTLSPFQLAQIAAALAQISGVGGGGSFDPLDKVRSGLGLDRLSVGGGSGASTAPTVEAGRYVAPGVYVGAKQSTGGSGTQATVQIDITRGLKLETDVGTGGGTSTGSSSSSGTNIGLTYQFEY